MWFPKSPLHWALVVGVSFLVLWYPFGFVGSLIVTGLGILAYWVMYAVIKNQPKPSEGGVAGGTTSPAVLPPATQAVAVSKKPRSDFAVANYDVPHCAFTKTPDGFTVQFKKMGLSVHRATHHMTQQKGLAVLGGALGVGVVAAFSAASGGSRIEVTGEAVTVDGKRMSRYDFGSFHVSYNYKGAHLERGVAILGYTFGSQSFEFGGAWPEQQASEVASALNRHLRQTPLLGSEAVASPEVLREARPTDF